MFGDRVESLELRRERRGLAMRTDQPLAEIPVPLNFAAKFREAEWDPDLLASTMALWNSLASGPDGMRLRRQVQKRANSEW